MRNSTLLLFCFAVGGVFTANTNAYTQHDHHVDDIKNSHNHLAHL